jgi:hypothetical protein
MFIFANQEISFHLVPCHMISKFRKDLRVRMG